MGGCVCPINSIEVSLSQLNTKGVLQKKFFKQKEVEEKVASILTFLAKLFFKTLFHFSKTLFVKRFEVHFLGTRHT